MAFAGLDVGTSGSKMLVYDQDGNVIFKADRRYQELGTGGYRELDPNTVWNAVKEILRDVGENCSEPIEAMAVACLGESVVCLDDRDRVLINSMVTGDSRGIPETKEIVEKFGRQKIFDITGLPPNELYGLPKFLWMNRHTNAIKDACKILTYEDFIIYKMTGERRVSYTAAARSLAFDIRKLVWSEELLDYAGIKPEQMSKPAAPCMVVGQIRPKLAQELHLNPNLKLVSGGHDQTCAALGSGLSGMDIGECGMGTCEFMFLMLPEPMSTPYMMENDFTCIPYIFPGTYLTSLEVTTCGALKNWARNTILQGFDITCQGKGEDFWTAIEKKASELDTEVMILPQFGSAGNPDLSMDAKGTITGLSIHTKPEEIYRAILEGTAFQLYLAHERLKTLGTKMDHIVVTGGGSASHLALQILADIFNMNVLELANEESGTAACMMMAATALGVYPSLKEAIAKVVRVKKEYVPDIDQHSNYSEKYEKYKVFYERMHEFM